MSKAVAVPRITEEVALEIQRSSMWWIPKMLTAATVFAVISLVMSLVTAALLFFSDALPYVRTVTDSGVVTDVQQKQ